MRRSRRFRSLPSILTGLSLVAALLYPAPAAAGSSLQVPTPTPSESPGPSPSPSPVPTPGTGPAPSPIPDSEREVPRPAPPQDPVTEPPEFSDLFAGFDSPQDFLDSLEEDVAAATEFGSTYRLDQLGEGDHLTSVTVDPQNFLNDEGQWQKIDTSLVFHENGPQQGPGTSLSGQAGARGSKRSDGSSGLMDCSMGGWANSEGPAAVFFPQDLSCLPINFTIPDGTLSVVPLSADQQVLGTMQDNVVTYSSTISGAQVQYWATPDGYKEKVVFSSSPSGTGMDWDLQFPYGLTPTLDMTGAISIWNGSEVVAEIPPTIVTDAQSSFGINFPYSLQQIELAPDTWTP